MALVKCPNCGRKNVSDSALWCPGCNYNVKEHFYRENARQREEQLAASIEERYKAFRNAKETTERAERDYWYYKKRVALSAASALSGALLTPLWIEADMRLLIVISILAGIAGLCLLPYYIYRYHKAKNTYLIAREDPELLVEGEIDDAKRRELRNERKSHMPYSPVFRLTGAICPRCGYGNKYMERMCGECGADLSRVPPPNPTAKGDIAYMWCPKCGCRRLQDQYIDSLTRTSYTYKRWCPDCGYILKQSTGNNR